MKNANTGGDHTKMVAATATASGNGRERDKARDRSKDPRRDRSRGRNHNRDQDHEQKQERKREHDREHHNRRIKKSTEEPLTPVGAPEKEVNPPTGHRVQSVEIKGASFKSRQAAEPGRRRLHTSTRRSVLLYALNRPG